MTSLAHPLSTESASKSPKSCGNGKLFLLWLFFSCLSCHVNYVVMDTRCDMTMEGIF